MSNPFNFGTPVPPQQMVGRWHLVQTVARDLLNPGGHFHMIVGGRRFGKSSFLEALHHYLIEQMEQRKSEDWYVFPVLVDLKGLEEKTPSGVFSLILDTLYGCFQEQNMQGHYFDIGLEQTKLHFFVQGNPKECTFALFQKVIKELLERFVNHYGVLRIVFLIDEIEVALDEDWTETLFNQLRYITSYDWSSKFIRYVIAGSPQVVDVREKGSPLLNMLKISYLEVLEEESINTIVSWAGDLSAEVTETVVQQSGGHPYIAQYLMHYIWESHLSTATQASVLGLSNRFIHERHADLENWLMSIGKTGQLVYKWVIKTNKWLSESEIQQLVNQPDLMLKIKPALAALCYHGFVIHDGNWFSYQQTGQLFKGWFENTVLPSLFHSDGASSPTVALASSRTIEVFYVYAAKDEKLMIGLEKQLSLLRRLELITDWHSGRISAGRERFREIEQHWKASQIILLLVSPDFIASDAYEVSRRAMERHSQETAHVIPIRLRPVDWNGLPFEGLQALPTNQVPIVRWRDREAAFLDVAQGIRKVVEELTFSGKHFKT